MSVAPEIPAWKSLLKSETSKIKNYPILYEQNLVLVYCNEYLYTSLYKS